MPKRTTSVKTQRTTLDASAPQHEKYNKLTQKTIRQTLAGKSVKRFKTLDDLVKELEV